MITLIAQALGIDTLLVRVGLIVAAVLAAAGLGAGVYIHVKNIGAEEARHEQQLQDDQAVSAADRARQALDRQLNGDPPAGGQPGRLCDHWTRDCGR